MLGSVPVCHNAYLVFDPMCMGMGVVQWCLQYLLNWPQFGLLWRRLGSGYGVFHVEEEVNAKVPRSQRKGGFLREKKLIDMHSGRTLSSLLLMYRALLLS